MNPRSILVLSALVLFGGGLLIVLGALAPRPHPSAAQAPHPPPTILAKRGEYLVHQVGMCIDCHSPRGERGEFIESRHLTGSSIGFAPTVPMPAWAPAAPPIAGLPAGWSSEALVQFLMTGERPHHLPPARPPMPPYRFSKDDAEAVAAYLKEMGRREG